MSSSSTTPLSPSEQSSSWSPGLELERHGVDIDVVGHADGARDHRALRMAGRLLAGDLPFVDQVLHERVVIGQLAEVTVAQQVGPGVADVGDVQPTTLDERGGQRGPHAAVVGVLDRELRHPVVGGHDGVAQGRDGRGIVLEDAAVELLDGLERRRRRHLTGEMAAHAVGDRVHAVPDQQGVLVPFADLADVAATGRHQPPHRRTSTRVLPNRS
jgi:hypothetical protein